MAVDSTLTQNESPRVPAWKRLGLKLKNDSEVAGEASAVQTQSKSERNGAEDNASFATNGSNGFHGEDSQVYSSPQVQNGGKSKKRSLDQSGDSKKTKKSKPSEGDEFVAPSTSIHSAAGSANGMLAEGDSLMTIHESRKYVHLLPNLLPLISMIKQ